MRGHESIRTALDQHRDAQGQQQQHLARQRDGQDAGGQGDREVGQDRNDHDADGGDDHPVHTPAQWQQDVLGGEVGEGADQGRLKDDVGNGGHETGDHAPYLTEPVRDEAVERAGGGDVLGHGHEADGEDDQDDRGEQECPWRADAVAVSNRDRDIEGHRGDRGCVGSGHEQHAEQADSAGLQSC